MEVQYLEAYSDFKLIVNQIKREYEVCHEDLILYHHAAIKLANTFDGFYISHVSRLQNTKADALAALTVTLALPVDTSYCQYLNQLMLAYVAPISQVGSLRTDCAGLAIFGQGSSMQCNMQNGVKLVKSMCISYTNPWSCSIPILLHGHLNHGELIL